jgi:hypothetical protein
LPVLKQDKLTSTFQERQIRLIESINKSTGKLNETATDTRDFLKSKLLHTLDDMFESLSRSLVVGFNTGASTYAKVFTTIKEQGRQAAQTQREAAKEQQDAQKELQEAEERARQAELAEQKALHGEIVRKWEDFAAGLGASFDIFERSSRSLIESTNAMVVNTGSTRQAAVSLRKDVVNDVNDLNKQYKGLFNAPDAVELMTTIINQTGIKDLGFYKDYDKMFLRAQLSMNMNLASLAQFADKFYRSYKFSAANMEALTEGIRKNTAGTSVDENELLSFMKDMDPYLRQQAKSEELLGGRSYQEGYTARSNKIESVYTWLDDQGLDPEYIFDILKKATALAQAYGVDIDQATLAAARQARVKAS